MEKKQKKLMQMISDLSKYVECSLLKYFALKCKIKLKEEMKWKKRKIRQSLKAGSFGLL